MYELYRQNQHHEDPDGVNGVAGDLLRVPGSGYESPLGDWYEARDHYLESYTFEDGELFAVGWTGYTDDADAIPYRGFRICVASVSPPSDREQTAKDVSAYRLEVPS